MDNQTILTGVKPTGIPHLGNYVGAIKPAIELASAASKSLMFVADYHALNQMHDANMLRHSSDVIAATFLALGLDPKQTIFYRQSDVPEVFELSTILAAVTPKGLMNRSHAYKAEIEKNRSDGKKAEDLDVGINMGLYTYPLLMTADILLFDTDRVPVGKDQVQHIEFARDIAEHFNNLYGSTLKLPTYFVQRDAAAIPGLDGRKMSKSYNNTIPLFTESKKLRKLVMKIITDSKLPTEAKDPNCSTLYQLYTQFADDEQIAEMRSAFMSGQMGYGDAKQLLFEAIEGVMEKPRAIYEELLANIDYLDEVLGEGAVQARSIAKGVLERTKIAAGIRALPVRPTRSPGMAAPQPSSQSIR